ncbi:potassium channel family protein [Actinomadura sp. WMMA1423]|uniref:potassium channel family protein n=1 Tax=Actinomadura sp. WMMA1423 TaxID=2591108 RepID=UPI0011477696|nr:potassium channel family protein [Actinomadura sp. WMMA1423]
MLWARVVLRTTLTTVALIAVYFAAPLHRAFTVVSGTVLTAALVALGVLVAWQARSIARSDSPRLRTIEALGTTLWLFLLVFASSYRLMSYDVPPGFSEPLTHIDALFFTITIFTSVGFSDIVPISQTARALTAVQMLGDLIFLGLVAKVFVEAMRRGVERKSGTSGTSGDGGAR